MDQTRKPLGLRHTFGLGDREQDMGLFAMKLFPCTRAVQKTLFSNLSFTFVSARYEMHISNLNPLFNCDTPAMHHWNMLISAVYI